MKVMLRKPFLYPTVKLFEDTQVLSVRRLYILRIAIQMHSEVKSSVDYLALCQKRVFNIPLPDIRTSFAKRFILFRKPFIYNKLNKSYKIHSLTAREFKQRIRNELLNWTYNHTEDFLKSVT